MHVTTRAWFAASLLLLAAAAMLHTALLLGASAVWAPLIHLTLFGWVSGMIIAVNFHTMPVFTGRDFPYPRLIAAQLAAFALGVVLVPAGQLAGAAALIVAGLALELLAALIFMLNVMLLMRRGVRRGVPPPPPPFPEQRAVDKIGTRATSLAGLCLPAALTLLAGVRLGWWGGAWWLAAEHLATLGWVMLMIVGVALHVLPRFSGRPTRDAHWAAAQLALHTLALTVIVIALGLNRGALFAAGGVLMSAALGMFAWVIWPTLRPVVARPSPIIPTVKERAR
jgi:hypothetical protein